jgi:hypothetical protein
MNMWMMLQTLIPRMEHHQRRRLTAQLFMDDFPQRVPGRAKQQPVRRASIAQHQGRQFVRQRKHDLEVINLGQQQRGRFVEPVGAATATALRTVTVDAGVIDVALVLTSPALMDSPAERRRSTEQQLRQHALHLRDGLIGISLQKFRRVLPQEIDYAERCGRWFDWAEFGLSGEGWFDGSGSVASCPGSIHRGHCRTGNQSSGLGVDSKWGRRTCR